MRISSHDARWGALLAAPTVLGLLVLNVYPFVQTLALSFSRTQAFGRSTFAGLENYARMFASAEFWRATWNTVYFCLLTILPTMVLALLLALLLNRKIAGRGFFRTLFYLPNILSMVAVSMAWSYLYNSQAGILNKMLNAIGLPSVGWVTDTKWAMISVAIMSIWS